MSTTSPSKPWLLLLPIHLGDGIGTAVLIDKCFAGAVKPAAVDVATSAALRPLFADIAGVRRAFDYEELPAADLPAYEWVVDLVSNPLSTGAAASLRFDRLISYDPEDRGTVRVRDGAGREIAAFPAPTFNRTLEGPGGDPNLPIWMLNAPLIAHVVGGSIWAWLDEDSAPRLRLRDSQPQAPLRRKCGGPPRVALVPCASLEAKRWPEAEWLAVCDAAAAEGWRMSLVFGPWERGRCTSLRDRGGSAGFDIADGMGLRSLARFLAAHDLVIANDCGPMHLAAAQGLPTIAIFGPTNPRCWFFYRAPGQVALQTATRLDPWGMIEQSHLPWHDWPSAPQVLETARRLLALPRP